MRHRHTLAALLAVCITVGLTAQAARAGQYVVYACDSAMGFVNHSWVASISTVDMAAYGCDPAPGNMSGLVTRNAVRTNGSTVGWLQNGAFTFYPPAGTNVARMQYDHGFCSRGEYYAGLWTPTENWTHASTDGCGTLLPSPWTLDLHGAPYVKVMTACAKSSCTLTSPVAYAAIRNVRVWVNDPTPPSVALVGGTISTSGWQRGVRTAVVSASDSAGVREADVFVDGLRGSAYTSSCDFTFAAPCPNIQPTLTLDTGRIADGPRSLTVHAEDSAGNPADATYRILVDNTPPGSPVDLHLAGAAPWRATNDFNVMWSNPPQTGTAPITGVRWWLCPPSTPATSSKGCRGDGLTATNIRSAPHVRVPNVGEWEMRLWLVDAAGNEQLTTQRKIPLRFDNLPPSVQLADPDPRDPQRLTAIATDSLSGLARGSVEIRREGSNAWISVPVERATNGFTGLVDDAVLRDGVYDVRASVVDGAGNERSTTTRASGSAAHLVLPLRIPTKLTAGGVRILHRSHGKRRTVHVQTATARFGAPVMVSGRLTAAGGNPLAHTDVHVFEQTDLPDQPWVRVGVVRTGSKGRFRYTVRPGPSRTVLLKYGGTSLIRPDAAKVTVRVRATTTLRVNRRSVVNGDEVRFRGRVQGGPMPASGKLLELQAYSRGTWRTFATPRASARSRRWAYPYRFTATRGTVRYRFRAVLPREGGFPFVRGTSSSIEVRVRGL
jgi:hypothetical protein